MTKATAGILLALACAALEGMGQVLMKKSMSTKVRWFAWLAAGVVAMSAEALVYTEALKLLDVTVAFTLCSLSLIAITLLSKWFLHEDVSRDRWIGVGFIFVGAVLVVART